MLTRAVGCHREACLNVCGVRHGKSADGCILGIYGCRTHTKIGISESTPRICGIQNNSTERFKAWAWMLVGQSDRDVGV